MPHSEMPPCMIPCAHLPLPPMEFPAKRCIPVVQLNTLARSHVHQDSTRHSGDRTSLLKGSFLNPVLPHHQTRFESLVQVNLIVTVAANMAVHSSHELHVAIVGTSLPLSWSVLITS